MNGKEKEKSGYVLRESTEVINEIGDKALRQDLLTVMGINRL